jgi:hypothetical protein
MNSIIVWVLLISPYSMYCASSVKIEFKTESECMQALSKVKEPSNYRLSCEPQKLKK